MSEVFLDYDKFNKNVNDLARMINTTDHFTKRLSERTNVSEDIIMDRVNEVLNKM